MNPFCRSIATVVLLLIAITGCVCAETKAGNDVAQVIVKFKNANTQPSNAKLLDSLAQTAKLKVRHVRPMSGGAQIYVLSGTADEASLALAIKQLAARPDVEYAELDRKLKPQKDKADAHQ